MLFGFFIKGKRKCDYVFKNGGLYGGCLWLVYFVFGEV